MCRLVAVRADRPVPLYRLLIGGDNAFAVQSLEHPDGWGLAYFEDRAAGEPTVLKSVLPAICDELFEEASFAVQAPTVLAHIRRASVGPVARKNCHPFRRGRWVFAHNGHIQEMAHVRGPLLEAIAPDLRDSVEGETDSELYFLLFLTALRERAPREAEGDPDALAGALGYAVRTIRRFADARPGRAEDDPSWLTCVATDGDTMLGYSGGKPLSVRLTREGGGRAVLFSSEAISTKLVVGDDEPAPWQELCDGELVVVGADLALTRRPL